MVRKDKKQDDAGSDLLHYENRIPLDEALNGAGIHTQASLNNLFNEQKLSADQTLEYLQQPFVFLQFSERLKTEIKKILPFRGEEEADYIDGLVSLFEETGINDGKERAKQWISENRTADEEWAFKLCFALQMQAMEAREFLNKALYHNVYNYRDIKHVFISFGLQYGFSYKETFILLNDYLRSSLTEENHEKLRDGAAIAIAYPKLSALIEMLTVSGFDAFSDWPKHILALLEALPESTFLGSFPESALDKIKSPDELPQELLRESGIQEQEKLTKSDKTAIVAILKKITDIDELPPVVINNSGYLKKRNILRENARAVCSSLRNKNDFSPLRKTKPLDQCFFAISLKNGTAQQEALERFINSNWKTCLAGFLSQLDADTLKRLKKLAYKTIMNDTDLLLVAFHNYITQEKADISAAHARTTLVHETIMEGVLRGSTVPKMLLQGLSLTDNPENANDDSDKKCRSSCHVRLGQWFKEHLANQKNAFIGYSKTAYEKYLDYRIDIIERMIRADLEWLASSVHDLGGTSLNKTIIEEASTHDEDATSQVATLVNIRTLLWNNQVIANELAINRLREFFGKTGSSYPAKRHVQADDSWHNHDISDWQAYCKDLLELLRTTSVGNNFLSGLRENVSLLNEIISVPTMVKRTYAKYDYLYRNNKEKRSNEIVKKELAARSIEEFPVIGYFSEIDNDPRKLSGSIFGRSILFLLSFYSFINSPHDIKPDKKEQLELHGVTVRDKDRFFDFYAQLRELAYNCGLAVPYPCRKFDYLLLRAVLQLDHRAKVEQRFERALENNPEWKNDPDVDEDFMDELDKRLPDPAKFLDLVIEYAFKEESPALAI